MFGQSYAQTLFFSVFTSITARYPERYMTFSRQVLTLCFQYFCFLETGDHFVKCFMIIHGA